MTILVIAEHDNAALKAATLNTVAAAQKIGGEIHVLVAGAGCAAAAQQAAGLQGVAKVKVADAAHYNAQTAENLTALIVANAAGYEIYARKSTDSSFFVAETIYSPDTSVDMTTTNDFQDKKNVSFFVVAFNSLGRSNYATAPGLKIADGYKPVASNLPLAYSLGAVNIDLTAETDTTWLVGRSFTFSEKMDTTKAPTLTISTAVATELGATYKWVNPTTLQIVLYAKAKVDLTEAATPATYSITAALNALTDVAGNTYEDKASGTTYTFTFTN